MANGIVIITIAVVAIISYYAFVLPYKDRVLFRLYEQRDNLAMYAMNNPGKQDTAEYQYLIRFLNTQLYFVNHDISFVDFYESTIKSTVENQRKVEKLIKRIKRDKFMEEIYETSFSIFYSYFIKKFTMFYYLVLKPVQIILTFIIGILKFLDMSYRVVDDVRGKTVSTQKTCHQYIGILR